MEEKVLASLPYLNAVVNEGIRLGSAFHGLPRISPPGGIIVDEMYVPEGTIVGINTYVLQTSEENFSPVPKAFRPERWLPEGLGPDTVTRQSALLAFSAGREYAIFSVVSILTDSSILQGPLDV